MISSNPIYWYEVANYAKDSKINHKHVRKDKD